MKILFLVRFYQPFDRGGSEWSTHDLATLLIKKGHQVTILTPNYGAGKKQILDGAEILRMPFPKKLKKKNDQISPFWTNNLIWFLYSSFCTLWLVLKEKYDVIHIQNNEFIPAGFFTSLLSRKKTVVTFRDYQAICNLGFCLWKSHKSCNFVNYFRNDFGYYFQNYVQNKSALTLLVLLLASIRGYFVQKFLKLLATQIPVKVAVSTEVSKIFNENGINNIRTIHNTVNLKKGYIAKPNSEIIYVGRLTHGKGLGLLLSILPDLFIKLPQSKLRIIGSGYLKSKIKELVDQNKLNDKIIFSGQIPHEKVIDIVRKSSLVVVPSIWPEPLPRSAIEAILSGVPVVTTDRGGTKEVVVHTKFGLVVKPDSKDFLNAIFHLYKNRNQFHKRIVKDLPSIRKHFTDDAVDSYEKLYKGRLA